ncbi:MAG: NTP transferase domain-containing protein [Humidesulfovibrio sp.]
MRAILLVAGLGTRLRPLTDDRPKCLVELEGRPMLDIQLDVLRGQGVEDIVLAAGYRAEALRGYGLPVCVNPRFAETNMVWTLLAAREALCGEVLLCYGDIVYSPAALRAVLDCPHDICVAVDLDWLDYWRQRGEDPLLDAETLRLEAGRIVEIGQKPKSVEEIEGQFVGLLKFSGAGVRTLNAVLDRAAASGVVAGRPLEKAYTTDLLTEIIAQGQALHPAFIRGQWVEVDTLADHGLEVTRRRVRAILKELGEDG